MDLKKNQIKIKTKLDDFLKSEMKIKKIRIIF